MREGLDDEPADAGLQAHQQLQVRRQRELLLLLLLIMFI